MTPTKLNLAPNTPEWLEARKNYRTASEAAIVLGISPFTTREKFKLIKAGLAKQYYSKAMQQGHEQEQQVREWFSTAMGKNFREEVWVRGSYLASLDGIDGDTILEIKTSSHTFNKLIDGDIPNYYRVQIEQQLYCSGAAKAYLVAYCPKTDQYAVSDEITLRDETMPIIEAAWEAFNAMPMPEGDIDASDNLALLREFEQYATLKREAERIEAEMAKIKAKIMQYKADNRTVTCNGYQIIAKAGAAKVDYKKAATDAKLDLTPYKTQGEPTYMLKMAPSPFEADCDE